MFILHFWAMGWDETKQSILGLVIYYKKKSN